MNTRDRLEAGAPGFRYLAGSQNGAEPCFVLDDVDDGEVICLSYPPSRLATLPVQSVEIWRHTLSLAACAERWTR